ncbi:MAG TPA: hypothetical protein EYQ14_03280 [Gammaproteobacteria bacterium]|nr:hypothetical protein [Gammaproteobacteria bacterium]
MGRPYYLKRGEHVFGPYTSRKLYQEAQAGCLLESDLISRSDTGPWTQANQIKGLDFPDKAVPKEDVAENQNRWNEDRVSASGDTTTPVISVETTEELEDVEISTSLQVLCILMILGCCGTLLNAGFSAYFGYMVIGVFELAIVVCQATITWGIFNFRPKAIICFYCLLAFGVFVNIFSVAQVFADLEVPIGILDILQCFVRPLTTAVVFTAFIWPNRKLFE